MPNYYAFDNDLVVAVFNEIADAADPDAADAGLRQPLARYMAENEAYILGLLAPVLDQIAANAFA